MDNSLNSDLFQAFSSASRHVYVYVCDMQTNLSHWSSHAVEYFGMPDEYMYDAGNIWLKNVHPDDRERYLADIKLVFSGRSRQHHCEYRALNRYGDYVWLECRGSVIPDEQGKPKLFAGIMTRLDAHNKYDPVTSAKTLYEFERRSFAKGRGTVLLLGIDNFREVINNYSYRFGDSLLHAFFIRMQEYCEGEREIYRMGGDEFVIVSPNKSLRDAQALFDSLSSLAKQLPGKCGQPINLSFSGGCVRYPEDGTSANDIISGLEHSLEHAKRTCRGQLSLFSHKIAQAHQRAIRLKQALTRSIQHSFLGFEMYYQPLVEPVSRRVTACEALLRWHCSELPSANTAEVIEALEASGEIRTVGNWIIDQVFAQAKWWQNAYKDLKVGVNVSSIQFADPSFGDSLIQRALALGLDPGGICIELTESASISDIAGLADVFEKLRSFGFKISLDDFGIGYSTLLLVRNLPADSVKIDHSFIRHLTADSIADLAIVESIVALCKKMNLKIVVEGVENEQVRDIVAAYPANLHQGYYYARPMPAKEFEPYILRTLG